MNRNRRIPWSEHSLRLARVVLAMGFGVFSVLSLAQAYSCNAYISGCEVGLGTMACGPYYTCQATGSGYTCTLPDDPTSYTETFWELTTPPTAWPRCQTGKSEWTCYQVEAPCGKTLHFASQLGTGCSDVALCEGTWQWVWCKADGGTQCP